MTETLPQRLERLIGEAKASGQRISMKGLSLAAGQGATYVRDIIKGRSKNPNLSGLAAIAKKLRVPLEALVQPEDMTFVIDDMSPPAKDGGASADYRSISAAADMLILSDQTAQRDRGRPPLDRESLTMIMAGALHIATKSGRTLPYSQVIQAVFTTHDWLHSENEAGRHPSPEAVLNFLRHIL